MNISSNTHKRASNPRHHKGFTLVELLVAMTVLILLTGGMVAILRTTMETWRLGERHREMYDNAQFLLHTFKNDFSNVHISWGRNYSGGEPTIQSWFLSEYDANARKRLRFLRTQPAQALSRSETAFHGLHTPPLFGNYFPNFSFAYYPPFEATDRFDFGVKPDGHNGLSEVIYTFGPDPNDNTLYRGVQPSQYSPRCIRDTLDPRLLEGINPLWIYFAYRFEDLDQQNEIDRVCQPLARNVLYFDCEFWSQNTTEWKKEDGTPLKAEDGGPEIMWDSTRALYYSDAPQTTPRGNRLDYSHGLSPKIQTLNTFYLTYVGPNSLYPDTLEQSTLASHLSIYDDVFPERISLTLVIDSEGQFSGRTSVITDNNDEIILESTKYFPTAGFVLMDREWIRYNKIEGNTLQECEREMRNTERETHSMGAVVKTGLSFQEIFDIPSKKNAPDE